MSQFDVVTSALRAEARPWDTEAGIIAQVAIAADGLRLNYLTAGIFGMVVPDYEAAVDHISARCQEGATAMLTVADALRASAGAYDDQDAEVAQSIDGIY